MAAVPWVGATNPVGLQLLVSTELTLQLPCVKLAATQGWRDKFSEVSRGVFAQAGAGGEAG